MADNELTRRNFIPLLLGSAIALPTASLAVKAYSTEELRKVGQPGTLLEEDIVIDALDLMYFYPNWLRPNEVTLDFLCHRPTRFPDPLKTYSVTTPKGTYQGEIRSITIHKYKESQEFRIMLSLNTGQREYPKWQPVELGPAQLIFREVKV